MAQSNEITSAMQNYLGTYSSDLMLLAYQSMDVMKDVTFYPDVKNKLTLSTFEIDDIVKPFSATFQPTSNAFRFVPRTLEVQVAKADLEVIPEAYRQTYLAQFMQPGVARTPADMPFEMYMWEAIFKKFGQNLNNKTAYFGVRNGAGTTPVDVADGYGKILADLITATEVTPTTLGAITSANALSKLKQLFRLVPEAFRTPDWQWQAYMSMSTYEAYLDNLDTLGINTGRGDDIPNQIWLRGYNGILQLKPVTWMAGSSRVIMTPKSNIIMGADAITQDLATANIIQQVWSAQIGIAAALGFQYRYSKLIYCNELS